MLVLLWTKKVVSGEKTFEDVPKLLKNAVRDNLVLLGHQDLVPEDNEEAQDGNG